MKKNQIFDDGGRVLMRELHPDDVNETYLSWFQDVTATKFLDAKQILHEDAINYLHYGRETRSYFIYAIIAKGTGEQIGNVKIGPIQWTHLISDLVTVIGHRDYWGKGLATEAIKLGSRIAFDLYGIRKLSGGIADGNIGSVKAYAGGGGITEGRLKWHHLIDGEARDRIIVSCFNPKFFPAEEAR